MGERKGTKALELWCRRMTDGYPGVKIDNMTTSWRDGLGFCAIIHHFRPDLIDFPKLNKDDIYHNNELAFRIAEHHLGIPALLEPEDMVECRVPDRLSILTYLSQFYQAFAVRNSPNRIAPKRPQTSPDHGIVSPTSTSPPTKMAWPGGPRREPCSKCGLPVFIAERLNVGKRLFHRTCFRCARCGSQLALANYYETEAGDNCCEICPDEEKEIGRKVATDSPEKSFLFRSMSDEEKTASLKTFSDGPDAYSTQFETAVDRPNSPTLAHNFTEARSKFFQAHLDDDDDDGNDTTDSGNDDIPPDLPKSGPPKLDSLSDADSGFPSHTVHSSVSDSASGQYDVTKEGLVKARTKLFEQKSDVHTQIVPSTNLAAVVPLDDLEDFDDISKKDLDLEEIPPRDSLIDKVSMDKREVSEESQPDTPHQTQPDLLVESHRKDVLSSEEKTEGPIDISDDSVVEILDSSDDVPKVVVEILDSSDDAPKILIADEHSDMNINHEKDAITIEDSPVPESNDEIKETPRMQPLVVTVQANSDNSFLSASSNLDSSLDSNVPHRGYFSALQTRESETPLKYDISEQEEEYPEELNPFDDEQEEKQELSTSLNPFGDSEGEEERPVKPIPSPRLRKKIIPAAEDREIKGTPDHLAKIYMQRISVNPFEDESPEQPPLPANRKKKVIKAEKISLNPFGSDDEQDEEEVSKLPVPTPRTSRASTTTAQPGTPQPRPREWAKTTPTSTLQKKKKPAPKPPGAPQGAADQQQPRSDNDSLTSSPSHSLCPSPRLTPRHRKSKRAPLPPGRVSSTPVTDISENVSDHLSSTKLSPVHPEDPQSRTKDLEHEKCVKDEENRNRQQISTVVQSKSPTPSDTTSSSLSTDKSTHGKWKRGKGRAPAKPVAQRRAPRVIPLVEIRRELDVIEVQQQGLERQGVRLEQIIREKCEGGENNSTEETVPIEVEDLILQLFELVNEKNELFRKQTELMYLKRQNRLEEEYADVDYQIRCLMLQPEANKTDSDKAKEEELINRLVNIVERRNEIVECLEMDRVREAEEDDSINNQLNLYTLKREEKLETPKSAEKKEKKHKHKKINKLMHTLHKHKDKEKAQRVDVDKDVDEAECKESNTATLEKKKKKKFNLF